MSELITIVIDTNFFGDLDEEPATTIARLLRRLAAKFEYGSVEAWEPIRVDPRSNGPLLGEMTVEKMP